MVILLFIFSTRMEVRSGPWAEICWGFPEELSFLIEILSLLVSLVFFLLEAQEFLQVQRHLSIRTSGYPGGAWVSVMTLSPCHLWTAYSRPPSSREKQTLCLLRPLCSGSLGLPGLPVCSLPLYIIGRLTGGHALPTCTQFVADPTVPGKAPLGKEEKPIFLTVFILILYL